MAMPPYAYMEAKRAAELHVQLRIENRDSLTEDLGSVEYMEVFLDRREDHFRISAEGSLHFRIDGPSKKPAEPTPGWWEVRRARREFP